MHVVGIHTHIENRRAVVEFVVLRQEEGSWEPHDNFTIRTDPQQDLPQQLMNLARDLPHRLNSYDIQAAVLRDRDHGPGHKVADLKIDFTADGVVLAELRQRCQKTRTANGKQIGSMVGKPKENALSEAATEFGEKYKDAGAAARAAATLV